MKRVAQLSVSFVVATIEDRDGGLQESIRVGVASHRQQLNQRKENA